jgi:hypothetical protein
VAPKKQHIFHAAAFPPGCSHTQPLPPARLPACALLPPSSLLQVVKQCVGTEGVEPDYIKAEILPDFFKAFWNRRMALDRRNYKALVETTVALGNTVGAVCACVCGGGLCMAGPLLIL